MTARDLSQRPDIDDTIRRMKRKGDAFALATVVRTLSVTAAKPGAKAILDQQGEVIEGWIGGGCARGVVSKVARQCIADGEPRFVSVHPDDVLKDLGLDTGADVNGRWVASNLCPSKGSMEIFIEPYLANPELIVVGSSPVAASICQLGALFDFSVATVGDGVDELARLALTTYRAWDEVETEHTHRYIVIATQGTGDLEALLAALNVQSRHVGFVGSHRKMAHLKNRLAAASCNQNKLSRIKGPAGLDIGAVTPHEIALSILAELVQIRRQRAPNRQPDS